MEQSEAVQAMLTEIDQRYGKGTNDVRPTGNIVFVTRRFGDGKTYCIARAYADGADGWSWRLFDKPIQIEQD